LDLSVNDIAALVQGRVNGDGSRKLSGAAGLAEATASDLSFLKDAKNAKARELVGTTRAGAVLVPEGFDGKAHTFIEVKNPLAAFSAVLGVMAEEKRTVTAGVHAQAAISKTAQIG
jgi:UDP-3-O-[3-hydroxymyristoyl] glucosamine N-acyltransferase